MPWLARSHLVLAKCKWSRAWRASHLALLGLPRLQDSYQPPSHLFSCRQTKLLILTLTSSCFSFFGHPLTLVSLVTPVNPFIPAIPVTPVIIQ